jgi:SAM-dependent methyltransferase
MSKMAPGKCAEEPDTSLMGSLWDGLHRVRRFRPRYPEGEVVRFMARNFRPSDPSKVKVLDVGAGAGRHTIFLKENGYNVVSLDLSKRGLKEIAGLEIQLGLSAVLCCSSFAPLPFKHGAFDAVISWGVVYYSNSAMFQQAFQETSRVLKKRGKAFISTRTTSDYRCCKGKPLGKCSYVLDIPDTNEKGMTMHFATRKELEGILPKYFDSYAIERVETTFDNGRHKNSDWLITAVK